MQLVQAVQLVDQAQVERESVKDLPQDVLELVMNLMFLPACDQYDISWCVHPPR